MRLVPGRTGHGSRGLDQCPADVALSVTGKFRVPGAAVRRNRRYRVYRWAARPDRVRTEQFLFDGDRDAVRRQSVLEALGGLLAFLGKRKAENHVLSRPILSEQSSNGDA
ncbi:MAG: hypothetical protein CM1200mP20_11360 [Pseudomonadota bacterium]|nr:MAG: hypothetical protein CM1200mP20_11360 [Pseudomonadota bacterium]